MPCHVAFGESIILAYELGSDDSEREDMMARWKPDESLPVSVLFGLGFIVWRAVG